LYDADDTESIPDLSNQRSVLMHWYLHKDSALCYTVEVPSHDTKINNGTEYANQSHKSQKKVTLFFSFLRRDWFVRFVPLLISMSWDTGYRVPSYVARITY